MLDLGQPMFDAIFLQRIPNMCVTYLAVGRLRNAEGK